MGEVFAKKLILKRSESQKRISIETSFQDTHGCGDTSAYVFHPEM
jgi:hypothetical protein